jgi:hypothetical protein
LTGRWLTPSARGRWLRTVLVLMAVGCGGPQKLGDAGATCFRDDDCNAGLICVAKTADDIHRVCSSDPTPLISMVKGPDYGGMSAGGAAGAGAGSGGAVAAGAAGKAAAGMASGAGTAGTGGVAGSASTGGKGGTAGGAGLASGGAGTGGAGTGGAGTGGGGSDAVAGAP